MGTISSQIGQMLFTKTLIENEKVSITRETTPDMVDLDHIMEDVEATLAWAQNTLAILTTSVGNDFYQPQIQWKRTTAVQRWKRLSQRFQVIQRFNTPRTGKATFLK